MIKYKIYPTLLDAFDWSRKSNYENSHQDFIDTINRVQKPKTRRQLLGIEFNDFIDDTRNLQSLEDVLIQGTRVPEDVYKEFLTEFNKPHTAVSQLYTEYIQRTNYGDVLVYGFIDKLKEYTAYDIKTTSQYMCPKYFNNWQHRCYLQSLRANDVKIDNFVYMVTDFKNVFKEHYVYNKDYEFEIKSVLEDLISFMHSSYDQITNNRVFNFRETI